MKYKIELEHNEIAIIFDALGELRLKVSGPVFSKIQAQLRDQDLNQSNGKNIEKTHSDREF